LARTKAVSGELHGSPSAVDESGPLLPVGDELPQRVVPVGLRVVTGSPATRRNLRALGDPVNLEPVNVPDNGLPIPGHF
jgi:hypothetical protein